MGAPIFRVGVIGRTGHGDYGHGLDLVWSRIPEAQVVAVADDDPAGRAQAAMRLQTNQAYADYRQLLDEAKPDIVAICPRWIDQHHAMIMAAIERGIHVFLEKPLCRDLVEADAIVRMCEMTHAQIAVAHTTRYSPRWKVVQELLAKGTIGQILEIRGRGKEDTRGGGEDLWVLGSHIMDMMRALAGSPSWCVASVTQAGHPIGPADVYEGAEGIGPLAGDHVQAMFGMPQGVTAYFGSRRSTAGNPSRFAVQIFGSEGVLEIGTGYLPAVKLLVDSSWSPGRSNRSWQDVSSQGIGQPETLDPRDALGGHELAVRDLLEAIAGHLPPLVSADDARASVEMIAACFASARTGQRVLLPLERRENPLSGWR